MGSEHRGEMSMESIIGAPLIAASKANSMMQAEQLRFLLDTCFTLGETGSETLSPVMVKMELYTPSVGRFDIPDDAGRVKVNKLEFQVPLISIIPINSLAVNNIDVDFSMEITSMLQGTHLGGECDVALKGRIAKSVQSDDKRNASALNVKIKANSISLPKGVLELIDMYTNNIQPISGSMDEKTI